MQEPTNPGLTQGKAALPEGAKGKGHRRLKNILLMPGFQIRMGLYAIGLGGAFGVGATYLFYKKFEKTYRVILELTDAKEEVTQIVSRDFRSIIWQMGACLLAYIIANVAISVFVTHRMVGPTYAFRRHIRHLMHGRYEARVRLRNGDAFREVAKELNDLAVTLEQSTGHGAGQAGKAGQVRG